MTSETVENCYFSPGCTDKTYQIVPRFKLPKKPEFSLPSKLCLVHLDWQPSQLYLICAFCAKFYRENTVIKVKLPIDGKELKKQKERKNKPKGSKGKKGKKAAPPPKKSKKKGEAGSDEDKPKEEPIKNVLEIAVCSNCVPLGAESLPPIVHKPEF